MHAEVEKDDIKKSIFKLGKNRKENTEIKTHNYVEKKNTNLIDNSSRNTNSINMLIENESERVSENNGKEEEKEKKEEKKGKKDKKGKRSKSKKQKLKDDNETKTNDLTNENEKNSLDTKNKKKRKKSKSKSKKKINLIPSEEDSQSQTNNNKQNEKDIDKLTEGGQIKKQQQGDTYDKDNFDKISKVEDIIAKKKQLKESKDFDAILNGQNAGKKKDNADEDEKEIELDDDPDKDYDLIDNSKEDKKSENTGKKKKHSKKKDKKPGKRKKNANPPTHKKSNGKEEDKKSKGSSKNNRTSFFSEPQEINNNIIQVRDNYNSAPSSGVKFKKNGKEDEYIVVDEDYLKDKSNDYKSENRGLLRLIFSMIKNNNTIFFVIFKKENDLFALVSVIILSLNFYIFINAFLMFNSSSLHLFIDQDTDLEEKTKGKYIFLNILVPSLLYYVTSKIKKRTSIKEFICDKNYQYENVYNNAKLNKGEKKIRIHDLITDVIKFKNTKEKDANIVFLYGIIFLVFNCHFITCFLGIYENSYDCLILNVFISLIFTLIFTSTIFVFSSILRFSAKKYKWDCLFRISQFLNPINNFYNELPYNDVNGEDDEVEEKKKLE